MISKLMAKMSISCKQATALASDSFERKLTLKERWQLRYHAGMCIFCNRWKPQLEMIEKALLAISKSFESGTAPDGKGMDIETKQRMKESIRREQSQ